MQRQSQRCAHPGKLFRRFFGKRMRMFVVMVMVMFVKMIVIMLMTVIVFMFIMTAIFGIALWQIVMMKMKEPLKKKHRQKTAEHPFHGAIQRMQMVLGIRQEMEDGNSEHQTSDEADGHLQPCVS